MELAITRTVVYQWAITQKKQEFSNFNFCFGQTLLWFLGHVVRARPQTENKVLTMIHFLSFNSNTGVFFVSGALNFLYLGGEYGLGERAEDLAGSTGPCARSAGFL